jgi:hypothetical protein
MTTVATRLLSRIFQSVFFLSLCLLGLITSAHADEPLKPFTATYQLNVKGLSTTATRTLTKTSDGNWQLRDTAAYLFVKLDENSIFTVDKNNLISQQYNYAQGSDRDYQLRFDWAKNTVTSNYKNRPISYALQANAIDRLALQLQLQQELRENRGPDKNGRDYEVTDEKALKTYRITLIGKETISVNNKTISAIHLQQNRTGKDRFNHLWLDPAQDFQMVKFEQWEKGAKTSDMILLDLK